ncbi:hypothetical protein [Streptomyces sp. NPDC008092]|uniref:hypothetical protein n=1 Tax=Streptomyces sp. NPDC008092 TaxID=3364808 RepID=UPI0036F07C42
MGEGRAQRCAGVLGPVDPARLGARAEGGIGPGLITAQVDGPVRVERELTPQ